MRSHDLSRMRDEIMTDETSLRSTEEIHSKDETPAVTAEPVVEPGTAERVVEPGEVSDPTAIDPDALVSSEPQDQESAPKESTSSPSDPTQQGAKRERSRIPNISRELKRLVELATKYPEIGAPLAELATKLGQRSLADRLLTMGLEGEGHGVEFGMTAANLARKEGRSEDALQIVLSGLEDFAAGEGEPTPDVKGRLLHLIRLGFAVVMFDLDTMEDASTFTSTLVSTLPTLKERFAQDPFYHSLLAQALWFEDRAASEAAWDDAVALGDAETSWNARGTWYKEAEKDLSRAEGAYRSGLKALPTSVLLMHNLAQVLMDRSEPEDISPEQKRNWLNEAESLLRQSLRRARRHSMRRHISSNIERAKTLQKGLPSLKDLIDPPNVGDTVKGIVRNIKHYGVFVELDALHTGLIHKSEIAHEFVNDPNDYLSSGDEIEVKVLSVEPDKSGKGLRVGLSRRALVELPEGVEPAPRQEPSSDRGKRRNTGASGNKGGGKGRSRRGRPKNTSGQNNNGHNSNTTSSKTGGDDRMGSLGEMLLAKLEEKKK